MKKKHQFQKWIKLLIFCFIFFTSCIDPDSQNKREPLRLISGTDFPWYNEERVKQIERVTYNTSNKTKKNKEEKIPVTIFVKENENINLYAKWSNKKIEELLSWNPFLNKSSILKKGDTFNFLFTSSELQKFNGLRDAFHAENLVKETPPFKKIVKYRLKEGETLSDILKKFPQTPISYIEKLNKNFKNLKKDDILFIPVFREKNTKIAKLSSNKTQEKKAEKSLQSEEKHDGKQKLTQQEANNKFIKYKIKKGETAWSVSVKYNISLQSILDANPEKSWEKLFVGDVILIPNPNINSETKNSFITTQ